VTARKLSAARGLERTLRAIAGRLDDSHAALVALARGLAAAVDAEPGNAALWREYRATVVALGQVSAGEVDADTAAFLVSIRTPALRLAAAPEESP
jgi:site-specific recombinase